MVIFANPSSGALARKPNWRKPRPMTPDRSLVEPGKHAEHSWPKTRPTVASDMLAPLVSERVMPTLTRRLLSPAAQRRVRNSPVDAHIEELTVFLIEVDLVACWRLCERWRVQGGSVDDLVMRVLSGSARQLGEQWLEDEIDFGTCTAAMTALSILLRRIECDMGGRQVSPRTRSRLLILPVPGEAHSFGSQVGAFYLRRRGFEVRAGVAATPDEVLFLAAQAPVDAIGLSIAGQEQLPMLAESLRVIRSDPDTARLPVFIGGSLVQCSPAKIRRLNVDLILADIVSAPGALTRLLAPETKSAATL